MQHSRPVIDYDLQLSRREENPLERLSRFVITDINTAMRLVAIDRHIDGSAWFYYPGLNLFFPRDEKWYVVEVTLCVSLESFQFYVLIFISQKATGTGPSLFVLWTLTKFDHELTSSEGKGDTDLNGIWCRECF